MKCPNCDSKGAYVGLNVIECDSPICRYYFNKCDTNILHGPVLIIIEGKADHRGIVASVEELNANPEVVIKLPRTAKILQGSSTGTSIYPITKKFSVDFADTYEPNLNDIMIIKAHIVDANGYVDGYIPTVLYLHLEAIKVEWV
jgi:hypothetical protein